jgi:hypothetical protein
VSLVRGDAQGAAQRVGALQGLERLHDVVVEKDGVGEELQDLRDLQAGQDHARDLARRASPAQLLHHLLGLWLGQTHIHLLVQELAQVVLQCLGGGEEQHGLSHRSSRKSRHRGRRRRSKRGQLDLLTVGCGRLDVNPLTAAVRRGRSTLHADRSHRHLPAHLLTPLGPGEPQAPALVEVGLLLRHPKETDNVLLSRAAGWEEPPADALLARMDERAHTRIGAVVAGTAGDGRLQSTVIQMGLCVPLEGVEPRRVGERGHLCRCGVAVSSRRERVRLSCCG